MKLYGISLSLIAWFFIFFQLTLSTGPVSNFFSFFTIQCNLLIALGLSTSHFIPETKLGHFFSGLSAQSAIAVYIFIVGLVYNVALRGIVQLSGWSVLVDNMLHVVIPLLYILYWFLFSSKGTLHWKDGFNWTLFPLAYIMYTLIRGSIIDWYPYPFLNVLQLGYATVLVNISIVISVFMVVGLGVIYFVKSDGSTSLTNRRKSG